MPYCVQMLRSIGFILALSILCVACSSNTGNTSQSEVLDSRAEGVFTLYKLDGDRYPGEPVPEGGEVLQGWLILKSCLIEDTATRNQIFKAFDEGIDTAPGGEPVDCFNPRHAISVVQPDGIRNDWLICFQCWNWYSYENNTMVGGGSTSRAPADVFNKILTACDLNTKADGK